ncbi:MAG: peptidoglycan D,D-transpeptidase FtsI family protein [Phycisphaerae bacterium]
MQRSTGSLAGARVNRRQRRMGAAVLVVVGGALVALAGRLIEINTSMRPRLVRMAERQWAGVSVTPGMRGTVFDARGRVVAMSRRVSDVFVDPSLIEDVDRLAGDLGPRINVRPARLAERMLKHRGSRFVVVASGVGETTAASVRALGRRGVGLVGRSQRYYPLGTSAAHVLGFVGRDGGGLAGIELSMDDHLRGRDGRRTTVRDVRRRALFRAGDGGDGAVDGGDVVLTLDAEIQRIAEWWLESAVDEFEAESGVAIVMAPRSGDVLAMACCPTFDPNDVSLSTEADRRNRAVTDPIEPGSTFKPFLACGALAGGFVSPTERIDCGAGAKRFGTRTIHDTSPHGVMTIQGIITYSSNIGMATIAERMGPGALFETIRGFGYGRRTGIRLPGEAPGLVYRPDRWTRMSPASVAMGYEIMVTPLQLMTAFCAILNDGVLVRPRLVRALRGAGDVVVDMHDEPEVRGRAVPAHVAAYMAQDLLVSVVERGTGKRAALDACRVLGKTGTAKLTYADRRGYEPGAYAGLFLGAAPAEAPAVAVLVVIRRPKPGGPYYGGIVAAPAVREIIRETLPYLAAVRGSLGRPPRRNGLQHAAGQTPRTRIGL